MASMKISLPTDSSGEVSVSKCKHVTLTIMKKWKYYKLDKGVVVKNLCEVYSVGISTTGDIKKECDKLEILNQK